MTSGALTVVRDAAELAQRAAETFVAIVTAAIAQRGHADVALAGGSTPRAMNALLAREPLRSRVPWADVRFFFSDERCVGPDDTESNYRMTNETLFVPLGIDPATVVRLRGEDVPADAAARYEEQLVAALGAPPIFDLIDLGMGPDGHTASLFPGTLGTFDAARFVVANYVPKFGTYRLTLTPQVLSAARAVLVTCGGAEKAAALAAVIEGPFEPERFPAQVVAPHRANSRWLVDAASAALMTTVSV